MKDKLRDVAQIAARVVIGIPIMAVLILVVRLLVYLATLATLHPLTVLYVVTVATGLVASYIVGNASVKKWRKYKIQQKYKKDFYG